MAERLKRLAAKYPDLIGRALFVVAERIMLISKRDFVPVDLGALRASGHVQEPERGQGTKISVRLVYGGPAASYAAEQHENRDFGHTVGEWGYLIKPMRAAASTVAKDIAKIISLDRVAA